MNSYKYYYNSRTGFRYFSALFRRDQTSVSFVQFCLIFKSIILYPDYFYQQLFPLYRQPKGCSFYFLSPKYDLIPHCIF